MNTRNGISGMIISLHIVKKNIVMGFNPEFVQGHISIVLKYLQPLYISPFRPPCS